MISGILNRMASAIDRHLLSLTEEKRYEYLYLHQFIMSVSEEITEDIRFNMPFYTSNNKLLLYIGEDKSKNQFYIGFCNGHLLKDEHKILNMEKTTVIGKWFYSNNESLSVNTDKITDLILESIVINKNKSRR